MRLWSLLSEGRVLTRGRPDPVEATIATMAGHIVAVGPRNEILAQVPPSTPEVRLGGRLVLPGFVDAHVHLLAFGIRAASMRLDLLGAATRVEALDRVRGFVGTLTPGAWLWGGRWDANVWPEGRPSARDLDSVTGDHPAALTSKCGHAMWLNTAALRAVGITRDTPDPEGGRIDRGADGEPTGILFENAMAPAHAYRPVLSGAEKCKCLLAGIDAAHAVGLTGVHNCEGPESLGPLRELERTGGLRFRVTHHIPERYVEQAADLALSGGFGSAWLRIGSVKAFCDGSLGAQSAAMLEPYAGTEDVGVAAHTSESLHVLGRRAAEAGLALAVHAIGDRAVRSVLDAMQQLRREGLHTHLPQRVEHAQHVHPDDLPRFARLGVVASCQPVHLAADIALIERHLPGREGRAYALGSLLRSGATLCFGSDAPVETIDPLAGIRTAVLRQDTHGRPVDGWMPEERLTVRQAVEAYTTGPAIASGRAWSEGALSPGYRADMTIISHDILEDPEALEVCRVDLTVVDGHVVFDREGLSR